MLSKFAVRSARSTGLFDRKDIEHSEGPIRKAVAVVLEKFPPS